MRECASENLKLVRIKPKTLNVEYCGYDGKKTKGRVITDCKKRTKVVDYYTLTNQGII